MTTGAHPLFDRKELGHYFGTDLVSGGMLPVLVVTENSSTNASYLLSGRNCSFSQSVGYGSKGDLSSGAWETLLGGALLGADALSKRTGLALKELREQTVSPGQKEQGFVYVQLPRRPPARGTVVAMRVRMPRLGSGECLEFELPFTWDR